MKMKRDSILISFLLLSSCWVICECRWANCNNDTYPNGGPYSTNLNRVINDLYFPNNSDIPEFATSSYGQSPNTAYALLQCVGNISHQKCSNCSKTAYKAVSDYCDNAIGGRVWMDDCFLRYDNLNFFKDLDISSISFPNETQISSNSEAYKAAVNRLLKNLSEKAYEPGNKGFAIGSTAYAASYGEVYGLVQCWRTLESEDCKRCLYYARQGAQECCSINIGAQLLSKSCKIRYEIYPFFGSAESMLPNFESKNPPTSPPPASPAESHPPGKLNEDLCAILLICLLLCCVRVSIWGSNNEDLLGRKVLNITHSIRDLGRADFGCSSLSYLDEKKSGIYHFWEANNFRSSNRRCSFKILSFLHKFLFLWLNCNVLSSMFTQLTTGRRGYSSEARSIIQERHFVFSLEELAEYTQNFDDSNKIGVGGFGTVYKGTTKEGKEIAVKKLSARSTQGTREFMNEVKLLANVQHRNLVKLLGICSTERHERLLVYDYFPNKSLDTFLFDSEKRNELTWGNRHKIIIGIARGLIYLHEDSQLKIIHRDIKANNILLDEKLNAKIADFGLARLFGGDETHVNTNAAGTYGYMAPEYAMQGQLSVKADVYSYGVLLLEILSGRKNSDLNIPRGMINLVEWAWRVYRGDDVENMVDPTIAESCPKEKAWRFIQIGLLCVQADATLRPTMSNVIVMISSNSVRLPDPQKPAFITKGGETYGPKAVIRLSSGSDQGRETSGTMTSSSSGIASVNDASITHVNPR